MKHAIIIFLQMIIVTQMYSQKTSLWEEIPTPLNPGKGDANFIGAVTTVGDRIYIGQTNRLFYTEDVGKNWTEITTPKDLSDITSIEFIEGIMLINTQSGYKLTNDSGRTWIGFRYVSNPIYYEKKLYHMSNIVLSSTNFGVKWDTVSILPSRYLTIENVIVDKTGTFIAVDKNLELLSSKDKGLTWDLIDSKERFQGLKLYGDYIYAASNVNEKRGSLLRSSNSGLSWEDLNFNVSQTNVLVETDKTGGFIILKNPYGSKSNPLAISSDYGLTWKTIDNLIPTLDSLTLLSMHYDIKNKFLYVSNWRLFRRGGNLSEIKGTDSRENNEVVVNTNPTNTKLEVKYPPNGSSIKMMIYNVLGNKYDIKYTEITNGLSYDISNLRTGIYFATWQEKGETKTKKIIIQR